MSSLLDTAREFSKVVVSVNTPTRSVWEFWVLHTLNPVDIVCCFNFSQWNGCVVVSHYGFNSFLRWLMKLSIFLCVYWSFGCHVLLGANLSPFPIYILMYLPFSYLFVKVLHLYILDRNPLMGVCIHAHGQYMYRESRYLLSQVVCHLISYYCLDKHRFLSLM